MLDAAVAYARERGVQTLEACPVDRKGKRISATTAFVGTTDLFEAAGFVRVQATLARSGGLTRWLVRRDLADSPADRSRHSFQAAGSLFAIARTATCVAEVARR